MFKTTQELKARTILNDLFNIGIDLEDRKNKVVIHTLRHTFASHLAINGTPIFTIQKLMNHKDIKMTLRYAKLSPDSGREAILNLGL
ncbi:tyrosine-type recombinase/integrase [Aliarcobacter cryaerophilus]|uniref:tyrosine-type recombinase/integrase n=1 Tax=Aliarcobacter cryaerophilus TaxID=28198 RepID=UPI0036F1E255